MARYRGKEPVRATNFSFDDAHPAVTEPGKHFLHEQADARASRALDDPVDAGGSEFSRGSIAARPTPEDPSRMSAEYVSRLEAELVTLKTSIAELGDPLAVATTSDVAAPAPAPTAASSAASPSAVAAPSAASPAKRDLATAPGGPASMAPPPGRAVAGSKTTLEDDLARAQAVYSDDRLAKFEAALEEKFKASGGYDSDLEREMAAAETMPSDLELARERVAARKAAAAENLARAERENDAASFEKQNEWMDEYRVDPPDVPRATRPEDARSSPKRAEAAPASSPVPPAAEAAPASSAVPAADSAEAELEAARVAVEGTRRRATSAPASRARLPHRGRGGVDGHGECAAYLGDGPHGDGLPRPDVLVRRAKKVATVPKPPSFLARDANRPKTIAEQRLEQDLAIEAELEAAELKKQFRAAPIPRSTTEPRYQRMLEREEARRERNKARRKTALVETERPFSFYLRDKEAKRYEGETEAERAKRRANKFQRPFKAKEIPAAVREARLPVMEAEVARRREEARAAAAAALAESKLPERMAMHGAGGAHGDATEDTRKRWSFKPAPRKEVPDFDALHEAFFRRLKEAKKNRPATVVQEFKLTEKDDAQRRRELGRIEADRLEDEKRLPEVRWPFASLRAKVNSTPPPVRDAGDARTLAKNENLATKLRRQAVLRAKSAGRYMSKAEREAREEEERARENRRRAAAWAEAQSGAAGRRALDGDQHKTARHKQQAALARETVEKVLLENNVYTYVEGGA